jgi:DNA polymerase I-like protein with 3'-5' exonuclease and polymerase domains/uracil-DNA glycosylase
VGFFFNEAKAAPKEARPASRRSGPIPIQSLNQLGCKVCPRERDDCKRHSPKMIPSGAGSPSIYVLGTGPNLEEDLKGAHWTGKAGRVILKRFSRRVSDDLRFGHLTQCMPPTDAEGERDLSVGQVEIECCRKRVVADIEKTKPFVIVGVGDLPLQWATGFRSALIWRGTWINTKIGNHTCWYYPILWPNFAFRKNQNFRSEYELTLDHDIANLERGLDEQGPAQVYADPYDRGIELITGQEPGDFQRLERALADLSGNRKNAIDIETNGLRPYIKDPLILTAAVGTFDRTVAFAFDHPEGWGSKAQISKVTDLFREWLLYSNKKVAHNLGLEQEWFAHRFGEGLLRLTSWGDTMAAAHTLDERLGTKSLDAQTRVHFGFNLKAQSEVDVRQVRWWIKYPLPKILRYNGMDSKWTDLLDDRLEQLLERETPEMGYEYARKVRLAPTLVLTQARGLPVDLEYAAKIESELADRAKNTQIKIDQTPEVQKFRQRFGTFEPGNDHHVLKLMREVLGRPEIVETDRDGNTRYTTDEEHLSAMPVREVPSARLVLELRGVEKLRGTYLAPILSGKIIAHDGLLHSTYSSMVAVTGRLASEDPNIQNWPKRKHKEIRGVVSVLGMAPEQWLMACDYGQIEFRVVGMASEDPNLVKYCWTGYDVHAYWAKRMVEVYPSIKDWIVDEFEIDWDERGPKTLRQESKNGWVFPQLFGSSTRSCAQRLHLPEAIADDLGAEFWDEFRLVKRWQQKLLKDYEKKLYVETLTGRRRRGPMTPNEIINHPIQGTAADIVLEAMCGLSEKAEILDDPVLQPVLNVHDDLTSIVPDEGLKRYMDFVATEMCRHRFDFINVPLVVEVSIGGRWSDLEEVAKYRSDELFNLPNPYK